MRVVAAETAAAVAAGLQHKIDYAREQALGERYTTSQEPDLQKLR